LALVGALAGCGSSDSDDADPVDRPNPADCPALTSDDLVGGVLSDCFVAEGDVMVSGDLVIEPGATLYFGPGYGMSIEEGGSLVAEGTADAPILLTGLEQRPGFWKGLQFNGSYSSANHVDHVIVEYGGSDLWHSGQDGSRGGLIARSGAFLEVSNSLF